MPVPSLFRGLFTATLLVAAAVVLLLGFADPGSLAAFLPLALAAGLLLAGRRLQSMRLILAADTLAVVSVAVLAAVHFHA